MYPQAHGSLLGGWRAGAYYPGRDATGAKLTALPALMATPAALLLEDGKGQAAAEAGEEREEVGVAPHDALCFPAI